MLTAFSASAGGSSGPTHIRDILPGVVEGIIEAAQRSAGMSEEAIRQERRAATKSWLTVIDGGREER